MKSGLNGIVWGLVCAAGLVGAAANEALATSWGVPGDGSGTCTIATPSCSTIQAAIDAAANADDIQVAAGTFAESAIHVNKAVTINGAGIGNTVVTPGAGQVGFFVDVDGVVISGLTVQGAADGLRFQVNGVDDTELNAVRFDGNSSDGIEVSGVSVTDVRVVDCEFAGTGSSSGIRMSSTSTVDGLTVTGSSFGGHAQGIYQANDGNTSTLNDLHVDDSSFTGVTFAAIYVEEIRNSIIENSTFSGNGRGILLFKAYTGSGVDVENVTIRGNDFTGGANASLQLIDQTANGLGGAITVENNTLAQDVGLLVANWGIVDIRLLSAATHAPINLTGNTITLSGTFATATAAWGVAIRGNGPVTLTDNVLDGGSVGGSGTTPPTAGVYLRSQDTAANFAAIPSGATFTATCNRITGFVHGITVWNLVAAAPGGLAAGVIVSADDNVIAGNSGAGIVNGAAPPTIDADGNFWGCAAGPGNPGCDTVQGGVATAPVAVGIPSCVGCVADAECNDGNECTTDSCDEPNGTCGAAPVLDGTSCDDGVTCSIPDSCQSGAGQGGGGGDTNMNGVCDADDIGPLSITQIKLKGQKFPGANNGSISGKGSFPATPPTGDPFDASAGITVRVEDALNADQQYTFSPAECLTKGTVLPQLKIKCKSTDRNSKADFKGQKKLPGAFAWKIKLKRLGMSAPFMAPVTVTVVNGAGVTRAGSSAACSASGSGDL